MLGLLAAVASFNAPTSMVGQSAVSSVARTEVSMSTKYTVAAGLAKKKNPNSGRSDILKGYTVGSRAPDAAVSSGTTKSEQTLFECAAPRLRRSSHAPTSSTLHKPVPVPPYPPCLLKPPPPAFHTRLSTSPPVLPAVRASLSHTRAVLRPRSKLFGSKPSQAPVVKGAPRKTKRI